MARPHNSKSHAPLVRNWVSRMMEENATELYKTIERRLLEDPIGTLKELRWCIPQETKLEVEGSVTHQHQGELPQMALEVVRRVREDYDRLVSTQ